MSPSYSDFGVESLPPVVQGDGDLSRDLVLLPHNDPAADIRVPFQEATVAFAYDVIDQPFAKGLSGVFFCAE